MIRMIVDSDTASDDAVALIMAARHPDVSLEAITIVSGNVPLQQGVQNALYILEQCGISVPVYAGCDCPLQREPVRAQLEHGMDGMGDIGLQLTGRRPADGYAVNKILELSQIYEDELVLVTLGPLTNIASALQLDPSLATRIKRCVVMGGLGEGVGNITPVSEYNMYCDPEAAQIVFTSGMPITMVGWDISRRFAVFDDDDQQMLRNVGTPLANFAVDIQAKLNTYARTETNLAGFDLADPIAMAVAIDPTIAQITPYHVDIVISDDITRGQTVVDKLGMTSKPPNVDVVIHVDREAFIDMLVQCLG